MADEAPGYGRLGVLVDQWMESQAVKPSVAGVAKVLGRNRGTVHKWMRGESVPSPADLNNLARLIDVSPRRLLEAIWLDKGYELEDLYPENPTPIRKSGRRAV